MNILKNERIKHGLTLEDIAKNWTQQSLTTIKKKLEW